MERHPPFVPIASLLPTFDTPLIGRESLAAYPRPILHILRDNVECNLLRRSGLLAMEIFQLTDYFVHIWSIQMCWKDPSDSFTPVGCFRKRLSQLLLHDAEAIMIHNYWGA